MSIMETSSFNFRIRDVGNVLRWWNIWTQLFLLQDPVRRTTCFGCISACPAPWAGVCHLQLTPTEAEEEVKKRRSQEDQRGSEEDSSFSSR